MYVYTFAVCKHNVATSFTLNRIVHCVRSLLTAVSRWMCESVFWRFWANACDTLYTYNILALISGLVVPNDTQNIYVYNTHTDTHRIYASMALMMMA